MIIAITQEQTSHCWVVHLDNLEVNFNRQEEAKAFVGQLKARIDAPHIWPSTAARKVYAQPIRGSDMADAVE
jgi:hypothetical protein